MKHDFNNHIGIPSKISGLIRAADLCGVTTEFLVRDTTSDTTIDISAFVVVGLEGKVIEESDVVFWN